MCEVSERAELQGLVLQISSVVLVIIISLQCFDAVGWAAGRASGL